MSKEIVNSNIYRTLVFHFNGDAEKTKKVTEWILNMIDDECEQLRTKVREAFISGYEAGHNDTVESCYVSPECRADDYVIEVLYEN